MRRLNLRLFLGLTLGAAFLVAGVYVLHKFQTKRSAVNFLRQADLAEKRNDPVGAMRQLDRYLNYVPGDVDARMRLGLLWMPDTPQAAPDRTRNAAEVFEKVLVRDPDRAETRRRLVEARMALGDYSASLSHLDVLLGPDGKDADLEFLRGQCLEALGRYVKAAGSYEKVRAAAPGRVEAYTRLASLLRKQFRRAAAADLVMDAGGDAGPAGAGGKKKGGGKARPGLIAANGGSAAAYVARARYRREFGAKDKEFGTAGADADVARALELAPDDADVILAAAGSALAPGKAGFEKARGLLARGLKLHPANAAMYRVLASVEQASGRLDASAATLERALKEVPGRDRPEFLWLLANALVSTGKVPEATRAVDQFRAVKPLPETLEYLEGRLLVTQRQWAKGAAKLERAAPALAAHRAMLTQAKQAYLLAGACYGELGNSDQQDTAYRRALEITLPGGYLDLEARLGLAAALTTRDRLDEAADEYRKALALPGAPPAARVELALVLINRELRRPESERQWVEADRTLADAERATSESPDVAYRKAQALVSRGRADEAARVIKAAREKAPDRAGLWRAQADLERKAGRLEDALRLIEEAERRLGRPVPVELRLARAGYWGSKAGPEAIRALSALEKAASDLGRNDRLRLLPGLADAFAQAGDMERSRSLARRFADEDPGNLRLRLLLFDQALLDNDEAAADRLLGEIRRLESERGGDRTLGLCCEASLLLRRAQRGQAEDRDRSLVRARGLLAEAARIRPNWPGVATAEAVIDERQGRPESALVHYLRAVDLGERNPDVVLRAARLLYERQRYAQADRLLRGLQNQSALTGVQQLMASDLAVQSRDYARALDKARAAVAAGPKDYRNHLWLGKILYLVAKRAEADGRKAQAQAGLADAENSFRRSVGLSKDDQAPRVALVQFLADNGRKADAEAVIREIEAAATDGHGRLAVAQARVAVGDVDKAAGLYRAAVAAAPDDPETLKAAAAFAIARPLKKADRLKEAEPILKKLEGLASKAPRDAAWARNARAVLAASGGGARGAVEALDILGPAAKAGPDETRTGPDAQDRRARALVLAVQPNRAGRRGAIAVLEDLLKEGAASADDRLLLARLQDADGNWPRADALFQGLMASDGSDPACLAYYSDALLRRGRTDGAKVRVGRLGQVAPDSPQTKLLEAQLLNAQGHPDEAVKLITAFVRGKDELAPGFAEVLEGFKEYDAAERLYRGAAARAGQPDASFPLILFLARRGRTKEALELCEAAWATAAPEVVSNVNVRVLTEAGTQDDTAYRRLTARLEEAVKKHPDLDTIRLDLANLRSFRGDYDAAEVIFRTLFDHEKVAGNALNNMAWLLALRDGKGGEALPLIDRAIKIDGESASLLDTRAVVYMALGRVEDAVRDLENAASFRPVPVVFFHLAEAYRRAGKLADAGKTFQKGKDAGLTASSIHPLERASYDRLLAELAKK